MTNGIPTAFHKIEINQNITKKLDEDVINSCNNRGQIESLALHLLSA